MATTSIDICARALVMIGASPISSFSDGSTEALVASNIYTDVTEASLTRHRWRFATTQGSLSLLTNTPAGRYDYAYQMPTSPEVLQIISVTCNDYVIPYSRYQDYIYVNNYGSSSSLIMDYIYKVDESYFPPHFRSVFCTEFEDGIFPLEIPRCWAMGWAAVSYTHLTLPTTPYV